MIVTLKIIHFLAFAIGIGGGVGSMLIGMRMGDVEPSARPVLASIRATIGRLALASLILLWLTGIILVYQIYNGWAVLPDSFWFKIAFVVILTAVSVSMNLIAARAQRENQPPPAKTLSRLGQLATVASVLAVVFAALAFTG